MNRSLVVFMVTQERMGSPEAVVIYFASATYHLSKALPINRSPSQQLFFVSSRNGKERGVTRQNGCIRDQFPTRSADYCVVTKGASHIETRCLTEQRHAAKKA